MKKRQDNWTKKEDKILLETVINHIKNGKTQVEALETVSNEISRTIAACGYRWNSVVRKQHTEAIEEAKKERHGKTPKQNKPHKERQILFSDVINYLNNLYDEIGDEVDLIAVHKDKEHLKEKVKDYQIQLEESESRNEELQKRLGSARKVLLD